MNQSTLQSREIRVVAIGASAGGIEALKTVFSDLPATAKFSILVTLHLRPDADSLLGEILGDVTDWTVKEASSGEDLKSRTIYLAPPDYHLCLEPDLTVSLSSDEPVHFSRPSIDVMFDSVAFSARDRALAILLTGANADGAQEMNSIMREGGLALVQNPEEAEYPEMPRSALKINSEIPAMNLKEISEFLKKLSYARVVT